MLLGMCYLSGYQRKYAFFFFNSNRDIPGGPMVKNPPCRSGDSGSVPGRELRSRMPGSNQAHSWRVRAP